MTGLIDIKAGAKAFAHIQQNGLEADALSAVYGASGAAKWLAIYGLDRAIFGTWLAQNRTLPLNLFGTSVGAFKLAAAARANPENALDELASAYIAQSYPNGISPDIIRAETDKILDTILSPQAIDEILANPLYRYHCGAVLSKGRLGSENITQQKIAMAAAFTSNGFGRNAHLKRMDRVVFADPRAEPSLLGNDAYKTHRVEFTEANFRAAVQSSGSIPVIMHGVKNVEAAPAGILRDGGLLDYHPIPSNISNDNGLVLYPHFYPELTAGWFDKYFPWRKTTAAQMDNVILISPSQKCLEQTELKRIPDRRDFLKYEGKDELRKKLWWESANISLEMGEEFLNVISSGEIANRVQLIG